MDGWMKPASITETLLLQSFSDVGLINRLTLKAELSQFPHVDAIFRQHSVILAQPVMLWSAGATPTSEHRNNDR